MSDFLSQDEVKKEDKVKTYNYSERKKISSKVMSIKKKEDYVRLFKIINQDPDNKFTENSNGIWLDFKSLSDETIEKVEKFLNKIKKKIKTDSINSHEYVPYSLEENFNNKVNGPKLSNYEKSILRRHKYSEDCEYISSEN